MNGQSYAIEIEHIIREIFSCERFGFGGVANSDFIRSQPFTAIIAALAYQFATADVNHRSEIEKFIEDNSFYSDFSIDELLSFETSEKIIEGTHIDIGFPNGEEAIKKIILDFRKVVK
jgi:hypothetical protein